MSPPHLAPYAEAGDLLFLSGQLPYDAERKIPEAEIAGQTTQVLRNIEGVLKSAGLGMSSIVKMTIWLRDEADFVGFNEAYAAFLGDHRPARSTVIGKLVAPAARVEIEVIAKRPG